MTDWSELEARTLQLRRRAKFANSAAIVANSVAAVCTGAVFALGGNPIFAFACLAHVGCVAAFAHMRKTKWKHRS